MSSDSSSSSSSSVISDYNYPADMTEEEAMAIWLRRDSELEEQRLQRERAAAAASPPVVMPMNYPPNEESALAYQRYIDNNRPGLAEAYVASSPGLALLLEQRRQELAHQRREEVFAQQQHVDALSRQQLQAAHLAQEPQQAYYYDQAQTHQGHLVGAHIDARHQDQSSMSSSRGFTMDNDSVTNCSNYESIADAQAREYDRLYQVHMKRLRDEEKARSMTSGINSDNREHGIRDCTPEYGNPEGSSCSTQKASKKKDKSGCQSSYYLATNYCTGWNTKVVRCSHCENDMYTNPLAKTFFCQNCLKISSVEQQDLKTCCEEKMQDMEDHDAEMEYY